MKTKSIKRIIPSSKINMGGHILDQALPNDHMDQCDPFLLIHHAEWTYSGGQNSLDLGIGGHPHRGFSPVTFIFKGDVRHQDSFGNDVVVNEGGTQWMHSGKGITHSERPSQALAEKGGTQEIIQFWVNSPAKNKMDAATYLPLSKDETPLYQSKGVNIGVVAGEFRGLIGPAKTLSPMMLLRGEVHSGHSMDITTKEEYNTLLYLLDGTLEVNGKIVSTKDLVWFEREGENIHIIAQEDTRFILLSGKPIGEKIKSYGPFVMNTQTEILQALRDAQMGKMGVLIENQ